jgi:hypothetical protein
VIVKALHAAVRGIVPQHGVRQRILPGERRSAAWAAARHGRVIPAESGSSGSKRAERLHRTESVEAHVVRQDEDHVGARLRLEGGWKPTALDDHEAAAEHSDQEGERGGDRHEAPPTRLELDQGGQCEVARLSSVSVGLHGHAWPAQAGGAAAQQATSELDQHCQAAESHDSKERIERIAIARLIASDNAIDH